MKTTTKKLTLAVIIFTLISVMLCFSVSAKTYGDYKYDITSCRDCYDDEGNYIEGHAHIDTAVITGYKGKSKAVTIPSEIDGKMVSAIEYNAFSGNENLESVQLPDTVSGIAYKAFADCTSLKNINIPGKVKSIDPLAFDNCYELKNIKVSSDNQSFSSNKAGVIFNKDKTAYLMYPSGKLNTVITVPDGVKTIGERALFGFKNLKEIKLPSGLRNINERAFSCCSALEVLNLPSSVRFMGCYAFSECPSLKSVTIPKNLKNAEYGAFEDCVGLTTVKFSSGVDTVYSSMFEGCINLKKVILPDSITTIRNYAFEGCSKLSDITIPQNVECISSAAFENCVSLKKVSIPAKTQYIEYCAFSNCTGLETVTIANGVKYIESYAFAQCKSLKSIVIPNSVVELGEGVFYGCKSLNTVKLSNNIKYLYDATFDGCSSLKSITIPAKVCGMEENVFYGCRSLVEFKVDANNKYFSADKYGVLFNKNKTNLIRYPEGNKRKAYTIPDSVKEITVTAFNGCFNLEKFTVSSASKSFYTTKDGVLFTKDKKELVRYPAGKKATSYTIHNKVKRTSSYAFFDCTNLKEVIIPDGFEYIGYMAFANCKNIKSMKIPNNVESLVYMPRFSNCSSLKSVSLPATLNEIEGNQFEGCKNLEEVTVSSKNINYSSDADGVFYNKEKTELLIYPQGKDATAYAIREGIKDIDYYAFYEDQNIKSLYIPGSIEYVNDYDFDGMKSLKDIYYPGSKSDWKKLNSWGFNLPGVKIHYNHKHEYSKTVHEASVEQNGEVIYQCVCGKINTKKAPTVIYKIKSVKLSDKKVRYSGNAVTPSVVIKDAKGNVLQQGKDYTVKYSEGRIKPGKYKVKVTFKGKYKGSEVLTFVISPAKVNLKKVAAGSKSAVITWDKHPGVTGYEVTYSNTNKFKKVKTYSVSGASSKKMTIKKLTKGKTYYFKVRAYKNVSGTKVYGPYSSVKSAKIK